MFKQAILLKFIEIHRRHLIETYILYLKFTDRDEYYTLWIHFFYQHQFCHNITFIVSLLLLECSSVKHLFLLVFSKYSFALLIIRSKGLILLIFTYFESLIVTYPV